MMNLNYHLMIQNHHDDEDNDDDENDVYFLCHRQSVKLKYRKYYSNCLGYLLSKPSVNSSIFISSFSFDITPPLSPARNSFTRSA
jgi:hypothetical protein